MLWDSEPLRAWDKAYPEGPKVSTYVAFACKYYNVGIAGCNTIHRRFQHIYKQPEHKTKPRPTLPSTSAPAREHHTGFDVMGFGGFGLGAF